MRSAEQNRVPMMAPWDTIKQVRLAGAIRRKDCLDDRDWVF
jgi:hypothetical protein